MKLKEIVTMGVGQFVYWLLFFVAFKVFFLLFNHSSYFPLGALECCGIVLHGLRMDLSAAGYLTIFPALCLVIAPFCRKVAFGAIKWYSLLMLPLLVLMGCADAATFSEWQTRLNVSIMTFFRDPVGMLQSLSTGQWLAAVMVYVVLLWCAVRGVLAVISMFGREAEDENQSQSAKRRAMVSVSQLLLAVTLLLPIRGTVGNAPMSPSTVSFSRHLISNYGAYNFFWNFVFTALNQSGNDNPLASMAAHDAKEIFDEHFYASSDVQIPFIRKPRNVVLVILESFSSRMCGCLTSGETDYTSCLSEICRQGIAFDSCYATGHRSDKGIAALLGAYPALVNYSSIMEEPAKLATLNSLPQLFGKQGYTTHFAYGGDIDFYNTKLFLLQAGVERITERSDFPLVVSRMQKWGAPDEYLYGRYLAELDTLPSPFFSACYNISSHPPFDVPGTASQSDGKQRALNAFGYADRCLGQMLDSLRAKPLWDSTLVVICSDHTASLHEFGIAIDDPENYRIPLVLTGGVVDTAFVCHNVCSQTDVLATLCDICHIEAGEAAKFSKSVFDSKRQYAFFFRNELWGYVSPGYTFVNNIETGERRFWYANCTPNDSIDLCCNAYAQHVLDDYLSR